MYTWIKCSNKNYIRVHTNDEDRESIIRFDEDVTASEMEIFFYKTIWSNERDIMIVLKLQLDI